MVYIKHTHLKKKQQEEIRMEKQIVVSSKKRLAINCDFAENQTVILKDEIQGHHWTNTQISLFTAVCYLGDDTISFAVVSDDRNHDTAHALMALERIQVTMMSLYSDTIEEITIITDGAAAHFKNRYQFFELGCRSHLNAKWIFSATGHGKCSCDGVGGLCKHCATRHNLYVKELDCVKNAKDFVEKIQQYTDKINLLLLNNEKLDKFRTSKEKQWTNLPKATGIRNNHGWKVVEEKQPESDQVKLRHYMRITENHTWTSVQFQV